MTKTVAQPNQMITFNSYLEYAEATGRTLSEVITQYETVPEEVNSRFNALHMGLGVATEYFELRKAIKNKDDFNTSEELGDSQWYLANHLRMEIPLKDKVWDQLTAIWFKPQHSILTVGEEMEILTDLFEEFSDLCKKQGAYNKKIEGFNDTLKRIMLDIAKCEVNILIQQGLVTPKECLERNINKLYARYPQKFDSFLAVNRNLLVERDILEGKTN